MIISTNVNNQNDTKYEPNKIPGNNTIDKVYILSLDEAYYYYFDCNMGLGFCKATDYAINNSPISYHPENNECDLWWLRDIRYEEEYGVEPLFALGGYELEDGGVIALAHGSINSDENWIGVRPVIRVKH